MRTGNQIELKFFSLGDTVVLAEEPMMFTGVVTEVFDGRVRILRTRVVSHVEHGSKRKFRSVLSGNFSDFVHCRAVLTEKTIKRLAKDKTL